MQIPIQNGALEIFILIEMWKKMSFFNCRNAKSFFREPTIENNQFSKLSNHTYHCHLCMGGESIIITLTAPLTKMWHLFELKNLAGQNIVKSGFSSIRSC